jgi:hypothetical protein
VPPHVALAGLLAALAVGAVCSTLAPRAFANLTCVLVVTAVMWPRLYELAMPPRFALAVFLALGAVSCALCMSATTASRTLVAVIVLGFTGIMLVAFLGFQVATAGIGDSYLRYFAVVPLSAAYGYLLLRSGRVTQMGHVLLAVAVVSSVLAVVEYATGGPILEGNPFDEFRDGQYRSAVFAEHTLVLSSLLLCALTVAVVATRGAKRVIAVAVLFAGIATTFSRGALVLAAGFVIVAAVWAGVPGIRRYGATIKAAVGLILVVAVPLLFLWRPAVVNGVTSSDPTVASAQYREAIYAVMFDSLRSHPLGWGSAGLPEGQYTLRSPFGTLDVSATVDSELVHTALDFGYIGLALLAVIVVVIIRRLRADHWWSHMAALITASGVYLSIHSWLSLLSLWAIALGATVANPPSRSSVDLTLADSPPVPERSARARACTESLTPTPVRF